MPITERAVLCYHLNQKLTQVYKNEKSENQKFTKGLLDIFYHFGLQVDLSTSKKKAAFEPLVKKYKNLVKRYQKEYHSKKNESAAVESCVPDEAKLFFSKGQYPKLCFVEPEIDER